MILQWNTFVTRENFLSRASNKKRQWNFGEQFSATSIFSILVALLGLPLWGHKNFVFQEKFYRTDLDPRENGIKKKTYNKMLKTTSNHLH